ncbi:MAG: hypothetical protein ACPGUV_05510 [Polyangiales bacterium]
MRISNSFSEGEVQIMEFVLQTLLRGGSPVMASRHKDFPSLYRKVLSMKKRMHQREQGSDHSKDVAPSLARTSAEPATLDRQAG